ncbi:MAG: xanthine/CO dehydrogenase XdhC/CoxF family maturation factor [Gammaproteobacteria bacterium]|jgi:xanthine/CO dehydrogenase XdhC/CoxF family maturation factor
MNTKSAMANQAVDDVIATAAQWLNEGRNVALATVIKTWGSSPLPIGSQLVIDNKYAFAGSVSGGCIEGAVIEEAQLVMKNGTAKLLKFGIDNERAWEVGLSCGGDIEIYLESLV